MSERREIVLLTGSTGRIGGLLAERLARHYRVVALDRRPEACAPEAADCLELDVAAPETIPPALEQVRQRYGDRLAAVVHLVGYTSFADPADPRHHAINVEGTGRLLAAVQAFEVEQFVFASTILVHPPCKPGERIDEEWPLVEDVEWAYPQSKADAERLLRAERGEIPVVLARLAAAYDEGCHHDALARHVQRVYERQPTAHFFPGDAQRGITYVHLEDAVDALARVVDRRWELPPELPLLLGEAEPVPYAAIQERLGELLHGAAWGTLRIPAPVAQAGAWVQERLAGAAEPFIRPWMIEHADDHYALDCHRARELLGWEPRHTLLATLPQMVTRLQADPEAWYREHDLEPPARPAEAAA